MSNPYERFRRTLEECHEWPCSFLFKFIVPGGCEGAITELFQGWQVSRRPSRTGKYVSLTAEVRVAGSDEVVAIYQEAERRGAIVSL